MGLYIIRKEWQTLWVLCSFEKRWHPCAHSQTASLVLFVPRRISC